MQQKMQDLSRVLAVDVMLEDGIAGEEAGSLPSNAAMLPPDELIRRSLKGYSYAKLYDKKNVARLWVYKSGKGTFTRIGGGAGMHASLKSSAQEMPPVIRRTPRSRMNTFYPESQQARNNAFIPPSSYDTHVHHRSNGYAYKQDLFGFNRAAPSGPAAATLNMASAGTMAQAPPITGWTNMQGTDTSGAYLSYQKRAQQAERDRAMAASAMRSAMTMRTMNR